MCSTSGIQTDIFWSLGSSLVLLLSWFRQAQLWQSKANFPDLFRHSIKQVNLIWCKENFCNPSIWVGFDSNPEMNRCIFTDQIWGFVEMHFSYLRLNSSVFWPGFESLNRPMFSQLNYICSILTLMAKLSLDAGLPLVFLISCVTCYVIAQPVTVFLPSSRTLWSSNKYVQQVFSSTPLLVIMLIREG